MLLRNLSRVAIAMLSALSASVAAQSVPVYPSKPIRLVVPFAAGSGTDSVARVLGQQLSERLKQPIIVENRAGANGQIAAEAVARSAADGYTLFMTTNTTHSANPSLYRKINYDPIRDFTPVGRVGELPFVLLVAPNVQARNLTELIALVRAQPGKLAYGTPNSTSLVATETLKREARLDIISVPCKASPQALIDTAGGQLQIYIADIASSLSTIRSGKVRALAMTPLRRSKLLPDVPPIADTVPGFDLTSWNGMFVPAGTPRAIVELLATEIGRVLAQPDVVDKLANIGFEVWPSKTPEEFARYVSDQLTLWTRLIRDAGIAPE